MFFSFGGGGWGNGNKEEKPTVLGALGLRFQPPPTLFTFLNLT